MNPAYITALETRLRWLRQSETAEPRQGYWGERPAIPGELDPMIRIMPAYHDVLAHSVTYYMDKHFCQMVEHARTLTPDTLKFESEWLHSPSGWLYLEEPFYVPPIEFALRNYQRWGLEEYLVENTLVHAIGWRPIPEGTIIPDNARSHGSLDTGAVRRCGAGAYQFVVFMAAPALDGLFYPWSHFILQDGMYLGERIAQFEEVNTSAREGDNYVKRPEDTTLHPLHEMRWIYTAMYLMAQQLTSRTRHQTDRHTRRRAERANQVAPEFIEIVTLRRKHQEKEQSSHGDVDWQWQWHVRGHWRDQWYPAEGIHKPKFIEAYMKGPEDKPLKPPTVKLFAAVR